MRTGALDNPGSDIYIHGGCFTVGCIPLTDDKIKEVYLLAVIAKNCGQNNIPVNIFPFKMNERNMKIYSEKFPEQLEFWQSLQKGYLAFENKKTLPKIARVYGNYIIK